MVQTTSPYYTLSKDIEITRMQTPPILLSALELDTRVRIIAISGSDQRIQILRRMGLVEGSLITLLEKSHGNLLVQSADSRIIMSNRLAESIHVELI
jgi:Fe2+ transport system protein FeoA